MLGSYCMTSRAPRKRFGSSVFAIIGFRNRLIHGYDAVDAEIAWDVIVNKLPGLEATVEALLASA